MITLPDKKEGYYNIEYFNKDGEKGSINIEGSCNEWRIYSTDKYRLTSDKKNNDEKESHTISENDIFEIYVEGEECIILSEPVVRQRCKYKKLFLKNENAVITIGQRSSNVICINNPYVSGEHAKITRENGRWSVSGGKSKNGTFVNNKRVDDAELVPGDVVFILGYKFIIGYDFIAANIYDKSVTYDSAVFREKSDIPETSMMPAVAFEKRGCFYRTIDLKNEKFTPQVIELEMPPTPDSKEKQSLLLRLGPSVTMCSGSVLVAGYSVLAAYYRGTGFSYVVPSIIMAGTMISSAIVWPFILSHFENKAKKKKEKERYEFYTDYINTMRGEIKRFINDESDMTNDIYYPADRCARLAIGTDGKPDRYLWSKNISNNDFLTLCAGTGDKEPLLELKVPPKKLATKSDPLCDNLYQLASEERKLKDVNITFSLKEGRICGFTGERHDMISFVRSLMVQLTSLYSYDELKIIVVYNEEEKSQWDYARWFPHVWSNDNTFRYIASKNQDLKELSVQLEKEVTARTEGEKTDIPHFLVVLADMELAEKIEPLINIRKKYKDIRFSIFTLFGMRNYIDSDIIFDIKSDEKSCMYIREEEGYKEQIFEYDRIDDDVFNDYMISISNIHLDLFSQRYKLPQMLTFLEMFKVSKVEHLNCLTRWVENDPSKSLQTPIGVNQSGDSFYIDLHEKFHGPHGLIAGTTGSGKSETIITFILSLAVNYSPEEVSFLIIDYKGGGLADAFENIERIERDGVIEEKTVRLPHLCGTVTNLDGATIERSRISIESELKRRQNLFKTARKISNEGTMDIYKYQKLRRAGADLEVLPHLFIVCDEFAELKTQQPEFMDSLVSTARIGRSLGVHLILATQKPDSVVSPQIWSNSRFKICLKVQDKADSAAVIHCPDAAEISTTGRFYLQVGYNELFSLGQSAWCGADYIPKDSFIDELSKKAELINNTGTVVCERKIKSDSVNLDENVISELVAIRQYLISISGNIAIRPLWLQPIESKISLHRLYSDYNDENLEYELEPVIGKWDDLYERKQEIMTVPFSKSGNLCVYASSGSGMGMFFTSLVYSLVCSYTAEQVNIYILDFDSGFLKVYEDAPQVGDIVFSDEKESVLLILEKLRDEITARIKLFAPYGGEYSEYCRRSGKTVPNIVLILNNYAAFAEEYDSYIPELSYISREGLKRGIYFVLGTNSVNINSRLRQNFNQNFMLRMNDKTDYSMVLGRTGGIIPAEYQGRGLVRYGNNVYEFQTAEIYEENSENTDDPVTLIKKQCETARKKCSKTAVKYIKKFTSCSYSDIKEKAGSISQVPLGQCSDSESIYTVDLRDTYITFVSSDSKDKLSAYAGYIAEVIAADSDVDVVVIDPQGKVYVEEKENITYVSSKEQLENWQEYYHKLYLERDAALYQDNLGEWKLPDGYRNLYIVINNFESLSDHSMNCAVRIIEAMLGCEIHNIHYIVADTPGDMKSPRGCYDRIIVRGKNDKALFIEKNAHDDWFDSLGIWLGEGFRSQDLFEVEDRRDTESDNKYAFIVSHKKLKEKIYLPENLYGK